MGEVVYGIDFKARPGLFHTLTDEQQKSALEYRGEENHADTAPSEWNCDSGDCV